MQAEGSARQTEVKGEVEGERIEVDEKAAGTGGMEAFGFGWDVGSPS